MESSKSNEQEHLRDSKSSKGYQGINDREQALLEKNLFQKPKDSYKTKTTTDEVWRAQFKLSMTYYVHNSFLLNQL